MSSEGSAMRAAASLTVAVLMVTVMVPPGLLPRAGAAHLDDGLHVEGGSDNVDMDGNTGQAEDDDGDDVYGTIQAAVDAADAGDTVTVAPGVYAESVTVATPRVTLVAGDGSPAGSGSGGDDDVVLDGFGSLDHGFKVIEHNVTTRGFTVQNYGRGILVHGTDSATIRANDLVGNTVGVRLSSSSNGTVVANTIEESKSRGIFVGSGSSHLPSFDPPSSDSLREFLWRETRINTSSLPRIPDHPGLPVMPFSKTYASWMADLKPNVTRAMFPDGSLERPDLPALPDIRPSRDHVFRQNLLRNNSLAVLVRGSSFSSIAGNELRRGDAGMVLEQTNSLEIRNNMISGFDGVGLFMHSFQQEPSKGSLLRDNALGDNRFNLDLSQSGQTAPRHDIDRSNTADGDPIVYLHGVEGAVIDGSELTGGESIGWLGVYASRDVAARNVTITNQVEGVRLWNSQNVHLVNISVTDSIRGVDAKRGGGLTITDSLFHDNLFAGIEITGTSASLLYDNRLAGNFYGVRAYPVLTGSSQLGPLRIRDNEFRNNPGWGISVTDIRGPGLEITGNTVTGSNLSGPDDIRGTGIKVVTELGSFGTQAAGVDILIEDNYVARNLHGVSTLAYDANVMIRDNRIEDNRGSWGGKPRSVQMARTTTGTGLSAAGGPTHIVGNEVIGNLHGILPFAPRPGYYGVEPIAGDSYVLLNNTMRDNTYNLHLSYSAENVIQNNTVNGEPVRYLRGLKNVTIDRETFGKIGYLGIADSSNVRVRNLTLTGNGEGLLFRGVSHGVVENVTLRDNLVGMTVDGGHTESVTPSNVWGQTESARDLARQIRDGAPLEELPQDLGPTVSNRTEWILNATRDATGDAINTTKNTTGFQGNFEVTLMDSHVENNTVGLLVKHARRVNVENNLLSDNTVGLRSFESTFVNIYDNTVTSPDPDRRLHKELPFPFTTGIEGFRSNQVRVSGNLITNHSAGVFFIGPAEAPRFLDNEIRDNAAGLVAIPGFQGPVQNPLISENHVIGNDFSGILLDLTFHGRIRGNELARNGFGVLDRASINLTVADNRVERNAEGIRLRGTGGSVADPGRPTVEGNRIVDNSVRHLPPDLDHPTGRAVGLAVTDGASGVQIEDNLIRGNDQGVLVAPDNSWFRSSPLIPWEYPFRVRLLGNRMTANHHDGVIIRSNGQEEVPVEVKINRITGNGHAAVAVRPMSSGPSPDSPRFLRIHGNSLAENPYGVFNTYQTGWAVDARENYWGDETGPSSLGDALEDPNTRVRANGLGSIVSEGPTDDVANVLFDPWLEEFGGATVSPPPAPTNLSVLEPVIPGDRATVGDRVILHAQVPEPDEPIASVTFYPDGFGSSAVVGEPDPEHLGSDVWEAGPVNYDTPGLKRIVVEAVDEGGDSSVVTRTIQVTPNHAPNARIVTPDGGLTVDAADPEIRLDGSPSSDPDGHPVRSVWQITDGDWSEWNPIGSSSTVPPITWEPRHAGVWNATLHLTDPHAAQGTANVSIAVDDAVSVDSGPMPGSARVTTTEQPTVEAVVPNVAGEPVPDAAVTFDVTHVTETPIAIVYTRVAQVSATTDDDGRVEVMLPYDVETGSGAGTNFVGTHRVDVTVEAPNRFALAGDDGTGPETAETTFTYHVETI